MTVYEIVIASMIVLAANDVLLLHGDKVRGSYKPKKITLFLMIAILALVAGLRYNVGTDYYNYYSSYSYFKEAPLALNEEPGIKLIARLSAFLYDDPATMLFLAAVITVSLITITIFKNSDLYWLSILLYIFLGVWHGCFNGVRQYLAAAVMFAGHGFIKQKKFAQWCAIVFLAMMCHVTAIIGILFYFYPRLNLTFRNACVSILAAIIGINLYDRIFAAIGFLKSDTFDFTGVGSGYLLNAINPLRIAVAWVPVVFFWLFKGFYDISEKKFKFYMNMSMLHAILMTTAMNSAYLGRVGIYTGVYHTITWPLLLEKAEPKTRKILICLMLILYAAYWHVEASGETLATFHWIFQR